MAKHPLLAEEFDELWDDLERNPRAIGIRQPSHDSDREYWVYASPVLLNRPMLRMFWIIDGRTVLLASLRVVYPTEF